MIRLVSALLFVVTLSVYSYQPTPVEANTFHDVNLYKEEINFLASEGVIKGYPDGSFKPNNPVTRLQAVQMILNEMNIQPINSPNPNFTDIKPGNYGYEEVAKAVELGIIQGKPDGTFDPFTPLTREQMAIILVKAYDLAGNYGGEFDDVPSNYPTREFIHDLAANNITNGYQDNTFKPKAKISRGHFSVFMAKLLDDTFKTAVTGNYQGNIINGANFAVQGDWTFYGDVGIWKYNKDQSEIIRLADDQSSDVIFLNVVRNRLYYVNAADNFSIYRMKTDGSEKERIVKGQAYSLQVYNDWLYYFNRDDQAIYKSKMDGTDTQLLVDGNGANLAFVVDADKIYFSDTDNGGMYKVNLDGTNKQLLQSDATAHFLIHDQDSIYFINENDQQRIYRMKDDGTETKLLVDTNAGSFNYHNGTIYYTNYEDGTMFKKVINNTHSTERLLSNQNYTAFPMILNDLIYHIGFSKTEDTYQWYTMDLYGVSSQQIPIEINFE